MFETPTTIAELFALPVQQVDYLAARYIGWLDAFRIAPPHFVDDETYSGYLAEAARELWLRDRYAEDLYLTIESCGKHGWRVDISIDYDGTHRFLSMAHERLSVALTYAVAAFSLDLPRSDDPTETLEPDSASYAVPLVRPKPKAKEVAA